MEQEYPVPNYDDYKVTSKGEVVSYARSERRILKPRQIGTSQDGRVAVCLGRKKQSLVSIIVAAAKYGRWPEQWEHVRHIDGNRYNNSMDNLVIGCALLNVIDDIEKGTRETSAEYISEAISRLTQLVHSHQ